MQYFPSIAHFSALINAQELIFDDNLNFERSNLFNKCKIAGANNVIVLSVPIKRKKSGKLKLNEVEIDYTENWQIKHWRGIQSAYNKAPFFELYEEELKMIFKLNCKYLVELNTEIFNWLIKNLNCEVKFDFAKEFIPKNSKSDSIDLRFQNKASLLPTWFSYEKYFQLFEHQYGFQQNLSVIDLLFILGPQNAKHYLTQNCNLFSE